MARIQALDARLRLEVLEVVAAIPAASQIGDAQMDEEGRLSGVPKPAGWSDRKFTVAMDGRKSKKFSPSYLDHTIRIYETYTRLEMNKGPVKELNAEIHVYVQQNVVNNYPTIDVTDKEK